MMHKWIIFFSVGGWGAGVAARIREIFLYEESGKWFFYKESKSEKKKIWQLGGEGVWLG